MNARIPSAGYRKETGELAFKGQDGQLVWMSPDSVAASLKDGSLREDGTVVDRAPSPTDGDAAMALAEYDKENPPKVAAPPVAPLHPAIQALRARARQPRVDVGLAAPATTPRPFESLLPSRVPVEQVPAPPADDGFAAAQDATRRSRLTAGLARAGATAVGRGADPGLAALDKNAEAPMADYKAEQAHGEAVKADARKASDADPASPQSAMARQVMTQVVPGLAKVNGFEKLSYSRLMTDPLFEKYAGLIEKQAGAKASVDEKGAALARQAAADAETARHNKQTEAIGWKNADRERAVGAHGALGMREERQRAGLEAEGWDFKNPLAHSSKDAEKLRQAGASLENLDRRIGELKDIFAKHGGQFGAQDAALLADNIREGLVVDLGQLEQQGLTKGHQQLIEKQLGPSNTSLTAWINSGGIQKVLENARKEAHASYLARGHALGGTHASETGAPSGSIPTAQGERVRMRRPDGTTGTVPAAKAAEKEGQGWTRL